MDAVVRSLARGYALYIIVANRASAPESELGTGHSKLSKYIPLPHRVTIHRLDMSAMKLSFYVLIVCAVSMVTTSAGSMSALPISVSSPADVFL